MFSGLNEILILNMMPRTQPALRNISNSLSVGIAADLCKVQVKISNMSLLETAMYLELLDCC